MKTIYKTLEALIDEKVFIKMTLTAQKMVAGCWDALKGLGEPKDAIAREYLTDKQVDYIKLIAKRYLKKEE